MRVSNSAFILSDNISSVYPVSKQATKRCTNPSVSPYSKSIYAYTVCASFIVFGSYPDSNISSAICAVITSAYAFRSDTTSCISPVCIFILPENNPSITIAGVDSKNSTPRIIPTIIFLPFLFVAAVSPNFFIITDSGTAIISRLRCLTASPYTPALLPLKDTARFRIGINTFRVRGGE